MSRPTFSYRELHSRLEDVTKRKKQNMRQPKSPWNHDYRYVTHNDNIAPKDFKLEVDGKEVDLETYQAEQKRKAFAMRGRK